MFISLYRNPRDFFQESWPLNVLKVGAWLEFASGSGTGIERLHRKPLVQQEGVYMELFPESMMVIILITKLELMNMGLIKKGTKGCVILLFFKLFSFSSLFSSCAPFAALILLLWRNLTVVFWHKTFHIYISSVALSIYHYHLSSIIHPFMSLFSFISIWNITCLIMIFLGTPGKGVSFGKKRQ